MPTPDFATYKATPFDVTNKVDLIDYFTGDAVEDTFTLVNKDGLSVGRSTAVEATLLPRATLATRVDGDDVILTPVPGVAAGILVPGVIDLNFIASDQDDLLGRVYTRAFYIGDPSTIQFFTYEAQPGDAGIKLQFVTKIAADASDDSWFEIAPALADGTAGTYVAPGAPLYTPAISGMSNLDGSYLVGVTSIDVDDGSIFLAGDYIMINAGDLVTQEVVKVTAVAGDTLTILGTNFAHADDETVMQCARKFWARLTVPLNAAGGSPTSYYGTIFKRSVRISARV